MKLYFQNNKIDINYEVLSKIKTLIISCGKDPLKDQAYELEKELKMYKNKSENVFHYHFSEQLHSFSILFYSFDIGINQLPHWGIINELFINKGM